MVSCAMRGLLASEASYLTLLTLQANVMYVVLREGRLSVFDKELVKLGSVFQGRRHAVLQTGMALNGS